MSTQWSCSICSNTIRWDELFTFYSKGAVHFLCFKDLALKKGDQMIEALIDMLEKELKMIVDYKRYINSIQAEEVKKLFSDNEKDAEKHAALLTKMIDRRL